MFTVLGVPAHPLLVHAVVVLIPLAVLGALALAIRPRWGRPYGVIVAALAVAGAISATLAWLAGNQLEMALQITPEFAPVIARHGELGQFTMIASWPFAILAVITWSVTRRSHGGGARTVAVLSAIAGLIALALTVITGHTGADAVWGHVTS